MLEYNLYDNFNPNLYYYKNFQVPNSESVTQKPLPNPKARGSIMNYELWQTGYKYTSSGTLSTTAEIGDIVEVLTTESYNLAISSAETSSQRLSLFFVVIDIDESNKATLKNYFWAMLEGLEFPTTILDRKSSLVLDFMINKNTLALMNHGSIVNPDSIAQNIQWNRKSDTDEASDIANTLFRVAKMQPYVIYQPETIDGYTISNRIYTVLSSREWNRTAKTTRIDEKVNPSLEYETIVERSNYNFLDVYVKNSSEVYPTTPKSYTINDSNEVVDMSTYSGSGSDLPVQRLVKTIFYDEAPTTAEIKSEITKSSVVANIYFNQNYLMKLEVNDLVNAWFNGTLYSGYIADRCLTEIEGGITTDRLLFIEGA